MPGQREECRRKAADDGRQRLRGLDFRWPETVTAGRRLQAGLVVSGLPGATRAAPESGSLD